MATGGKGGRLIGKLRDELPDRQVLGTVMEGAALRQQQRCH